jgi:acyl carrier protein
MSNEELHEAVRTTIIDVLDIDESTVITNSTTAEDIPGWDSLQNVRIMLALEKKFGIRWQEQEIKNLQNVGDLFEKISGKVTGKR